MTRRAYAGGVGTVLLTGPVTDIATSLAVTTTLGMPDGTTGRFSIQVGRGLPNEEKMLASSASGGVITIFQRGYDGTLPRAHNADEPVRMVGTSIDLDEANLHVNSASGVHGLAGDSTVVGTKGAQTLTGKSMSGADNSFSVIPAAASPELVNLIGAEAATRAGADSLRPTLTDADARYGLIGDADAAVAAHVAAADPHNPYILGDNPSYRRLPVASLPIAHSGRRWTSPLTQFTATNVNPVRTLASLTVPAAPAGVGSVRLFLVTAVIKGFTTSGADPDAVRFDVALGPGTSPQEWLGLPGTDQPLTNQRMSGNLSIPANGQMLGSLREAGLGSVDFSLIMEKLSDTGGGVNVTNSADHGVLQVVQLV